MDTNEDAFEVEAQDEAREESIHRAGIPSRDRKQADVDVSQSLSSDGERSPLLSRRRGSGRSPSGSPDRHQDEPWSASSDSDPLPWYKTPSIFWLLPAFMPFCLAFGGLIVPRVNLILTLICQGYLSDKAVHDPSFTFMPALVGEDNPQCRIPEVQALMAKFQLYMNLITGIFSALVTPHLGALSDRVGRKKVITFAALGPFVAEIIFIIVGNNPDTVSVYWLFLGSLSDGLCGSFTASMAVCYSYAADCTPPDRRNVAFGYFHGTLFTGIAFGPILAGYLVKWTGSIMTIFYVALGCHVFFMLFLNLFIPESLSKERQHTAQELHRRKLLDPDSGSWRAFFTNYNIFEPLGILWPRGEGSSTVIRRNMAFLAAIDTLCFGVAMGTMNIIIIYAEFVFGWSNLESSVFLSVVNIARVLGLLVVLPVVTRLVRGGAGTRPAGHNGADNLDLYLVRIAILFDLLGYIGYAASPTGWVMILSGMVASLGGIGSPTLQSALTKHVPSDRTGQLLGATGLLHALARVVAPTIFNLIYAKTVGKFTQTVFVCLASVFVLAEGLSWFLKPRVHLPAHYQPPAIDFSDGRDRRNIVAKAGSKVVAGFRRVGAIFTRGRRQNYEPVPSSSHDE